MYMCIYVYIYVYIFQEMKLISKKEQIVVHFES